MAIASAERSETGTRHSTVVEEQLAEAVSRIRVHDVLQGVLLLATWAAAYAVVMVLVDKWLVLSDSLRQICWGVFVAVSGGLVWWKLVRPWRWRINPLYAAAQVEKTLEEPKNLLTGYVDVKERGGAAPAIEAALSARAAQLARAADVNHAVDHRSLFYLGLILSILLVILAVLFLSWQATQFSSLLRRAFLPFTPQAIATRTQITLLQPAEGDATITQGQSFTVRVHLGGRIPSVEGPDRPRLLIRYSLEDATSEEVPLQASESIREWHGKVPDYLLQTGFWYKVAAGDAETPEYRVTVRTLPLFTDFEVRYEYPAYMNRPTARANGPFLRTYRGTQITLLAKTNREPVRGILQFELPQLQPVEGKAVAGLPDTLQFQFIARESSRYRLRMDTSVGETNVESPWFSLTLDPDQPPTVLITQPAEAEIVLPANGTLMVDGQVGDDFGIDKVRLRCRMSNGKELQPIPYMEGRSFRRNRDNTWPTHLTFKLSADLPRLRYADNTPFTPQEGMVLEYWVEAIDNCTEAPPVKDWDEQPGQVGRSEVRRLRLAAPLTQPQDQQRHQQQRANRQQEEQRHNQQQQQRLETEDRTPPQTQQGQSDQSSTTDARPEDTPATQPKEGAPTQPPMNKEGQPKENTASQGQPQAPEGQPPAKQQSGPEQPQPKNDSGQSAQDQPQSKQEAGPSNKQEQPSRKEGQPAEGQSSSKKGQSAGNQPASQEGPSSGAQPEQAKSDKSGQPANRPEASSGARPAEEAQAPMPKTPEQRQLEQQAQRVREELERQRQEWERQRTQGGEAKPAAASDQTPAVEPGQPKPAPDTAGANPPSSAAVHKPAPKETTPAPAESRPASQAQNTTTSDPHASPSVPPGEDRPPPSAQAQQTAPATESGGNQAASPREKGSASGPRSANPSEQPTRDPAASNNAQQNPKNPATGERKGNDSSAQAIQKPGPSDNASAPGTKNGQPESATPQQPLNSSQGSAASQEPSPSEKLAKTGTGQADTLKKSDGSPSSALKPSTGSGKEPTTTAEKKASRPTAGELTPEQRRELEQAVEDLASGDPQRQQAARDKLDKTLGPQTRQAIEQELQRQQAEWEQLQKDLASSDPARRAAAQKRLEELRRQTDPQQSKADAKTAFNPSVPEDKKEANTGDKPFAGAQNSAVSDPGSKEPAVNKPLPKVNPDELKALAEKARDLLSTDPQKRQDAERALDEKLGREWRQQLQQQLQQQATPTPQSDDPKVQQAQQEELQRRLEELARQQAQRSEVPPTGPGRTRGRIDLDKFLPRGGVQDDPPLPEMEADPRHRARTAALQLQEFERQRSNEELLRRLGWSAEDYERFLEAQRQYVEQLQREAQLYEEKLSPPRTAPPGTPTIRAGGAGKLESRPGATAGTGGVGTAPVAPPGFEQASERFFEELRKRQKK